MNPTTKNTLIKCAASIVVGISIMLTWGYRLLTASIGMPEDYVPHFELKNTLRIDESNRVVGEIVGFVAENPLNDKWEGFTPSQDLLEYRKISVQNPMVSDLKQQRFVLGTSLRHRASHVNAARKDIAQNIFKSTGSAYIVQSDYANKEFEEGYITLAPTQVSSLGINLEIEKCDHDHCESCPVTPFTRGDGYGARIQLEPIKLVTLSEKYNEANGEREPYTQYPRWLITSNEEFTSYMNECLPPAFLGDKILGYIIKYPFYSMLWLAGFGILYIVLYNGPPLSRPKSPLARTCCFVFLPIVSGGIFLLNWAIREFGIIGYGTFLMVMIFMLPYFDWLGWGGGWGATVVFLSAYAQVLLLVLMGALLPFYFLWRRFIH
jgi:hypothetical protein